MLDNGVKIGGIELHRCNGLADRQRQLSLPKAYNKFLAAAIDQLVVTQVIDQ